MALSPVSSVSPWTLLPPAGRTQSCSGPQSGHCAKSWGPLCHPLCCAPLLCTQGSLTPCMAPGLSIIQFVLVDTRTGSGPWPAAGLEQQLCWGQFLQGTPSSMSLQGCRGCSSQDSVFLPQSRPLGLTELWRSTESRPPRDKRVHTEPLPTASPAIPSIPRISTSPGTFWG